MKKLIAFVAVFVLLLAAAANLAASQRVVVAEDFTGTWCQYCPAAANGLDQLYSEVGDSLVVLGMHYGDSYQTPETMNRDTIFYWDMIPGYPTVIFDGLDSMVGSSGSGAAYTNYDYYRPIFDSHKTAASPFEMTIGLSSYDLGARIGTAEIKIKNTGASPESANFHFVVIERAIPEIWQGMTMLDFVVRDMIPDENGEAISIAPGDSMILTRNYTIDAGWDIYKCQFVGFVQRSTKEIVQGAKLGGAYLVQKSYTLTEAGDGDGFNEPGESMNLSVTVHNLGGASPLATVEATTQDTFVTTSNGLWNIGPIGTSYEGDNSGSPFVIAIKPSANMTEGHQIKVFITKKSFNSIYNDTLVVVDSVIFVVGSPAILYFEDFESGIGNWLAGYTAWTAGVNWDTTQSDYHSSNTCIVNTEYGDYANKQNRWIRMLNALDLTNCLAARITWHEKYGVAVGDRCLPEVSTDSLGTTWSSLTAYYSGAVSAWQKRSVDITNYCSNKKFFRLRYRLLTDTINVAKGWQVDDIAIEGYCRQVTIWPGDCDNNTMVNAFDVLPIGMYWNSTGLPRSSASTSWNGQPGYVWPKAAACYADCDGNGIVNIQDVLAIGQNWRQSHSKAKGPARGGWIPDAADLIPYLDNYREIYRGLSGESEAVVEMKRVLENIFSQYGQTPQQFTMNIRSISGYGLWNIECNVPKDTRLTLKIYNIMGQEVKTLNNGPVKAGQHTWVWSGVNNEQRKAASGLYICRLEASGYSKTVKVVVVR